MHTTRYHDLQLALDFFDSLRTKQPEDIAGHGDLPPRIDYDAVAAMAAQNGFVASAQIFAEAFRMTMRARGLRRNFD